MFSNNDEKKLDWMYKGPNALVDREDYLLGRSADKTLEQLNEEEKNKASNKLLAPPKNHVEHECIPPSIRDYNKIVQTEQVDLQAKLQEDPLVLIKRQEDESRRQFLQNPIQLKKLQEAMQAQLKKKKNKKHKKRDDKIDKKLKKKLKSLNKHLEKTGGYKKLELVSEKSEEEAILDTILMHKFNSLKSRLSEEDLKNIVMGNFSDSEDSDSDQEEKSNYFKSLKLDERKNSAKKYKGDSESDEYSRKKEYKPSRQYRDDKNYDSKSDEHTRRKEYKSSIRYRHEPSDSESDEHTRKKEHKYSRRYRDEPSEKNNKNKKEFDNMKIRQRTDHKEKKRSDKKLSEEEKEALRRSMMEKAAERTKESVQSYKKYKNEQSKPEKLIRHGEEFIRNELLKSANSSSVADRIKANVNNIQRSKSAMESNFLK